MNLWTPNNDIAVSIGGKPLFSFKSLRLHQPINDHHRFELALDFEVAAKALEDGTEWLGKRIQIKRREAKSFLFVGVVTQVNACRENLDGGEVRVSGYSTTYLLENGESCHSWLGRTLGEIVKELCAKAGVQAQVEPEHDKSVGYVCQYGESDFTFIRRLAKKYQEWLYYDGAKLVFGMPRKPKAVKLEFDTTLTSFEMGVQTLARPARVFSYLSKHDHSMAENTPNKPSGLDRPGSKAFQASMEMFKEPALQYAHSRVHYMLEMEMYVRKKQEAEAAESHYVVGTSGEAELTVGSVVRITSPFGERMGSLAKASLGEYLIVDIEHSVGEGNYYANRFRAVSSGVRSLPLPDVDLAVAETQMARVTSNADPEGKGRVQVRMNWQTGNMHTDWIRVMTPDGGGSHDGVETNRGFVFIPEVGDHVLVGFRHGDPNRPYVMGSLFNGRTGKGGGDGNNCKSICTRSGISIAFDDDSRALTLSDPSGNMVLMDGHGHMELNAPNGIVMNASHIAMNTGGNITLNVGGELMASVAGNWLTSVGGAMNAVTNSYRTTVVNALEMCSASALFSTEMGMQLQGETLNAIGTKKLLMHSDEQVLANSRGRMDMKSDGSLNMEQKADDVEKEEKEQMALATVEFRPDAAYNGEFGFDWLRVKDGELPAETPYKNIIVGGYCDGERNLTPKEAYDKLKEEYEHIPITFRKDEESKYFVPYLNLYSKECVEGMKVDEDVPKPCYEASLRVVVDINEDVDRLEFDYDKDIFEIDKPTLKDKGKTKDKVKSQDDKVKITCKKSFDDETKGIIRVFAYPKECAGKQMADQVRLRSLAGKIKVGVNDLKAQKEMEFVLVCVKTLLAEGQTPQTGTFGSDHLHLLSNTLHHMYINPSFEQFLKDKEGKLLYDNKGEKMRIVLDFSQKPYSEQIEKYREGNVLRKNPIPNNQEDPRYMTIQRYLDENLANFLRTTFLDTYPQYSSSFTIFSFAEDGGFGKKGLPGFCELAADIKTGEFTHFKKNVVLFKNRLPTTLCHEILHGLGLPHTHLEVVENKKGEMETEIIKEKDKKYAFERGATDNIMSYAKERKTTWNWQWKIVREKS